MADGSSLACERDSVAGHKRAGDEAVVVAGTAVVEVAGGAVAVVVAAAAVVHEGAAIAVAIAGIGPIAAEDRRRKERYR